MAHTLNIDHLNAHREMLLDNYRCELRRVADRIEAAQRRFELGTDTRELLKRNPTSDHDGFGIQQCGGELIKIANQIQMVDTVLRSLKVVDLSGKPTDDSKLA